MGWSWTHLRYVRHRTHLNNLKYHLDAVNHWKAHAVYLCKRSGETSWHMASKATWWVMCARERAEETAEGQRCYCLTQYQQSSDEWPRTRPDVRVGLRRHRSGVRASMNHLHTLSLGPSCCFMASPATMEGWQPHSVAGRGREEGRKGKRGGSVVSERIEEEEGGRVSAEEERRDERQIVGQVQREVRKEERKRWWTRWTRSQCTASRSVGAVEEKKKKRCLNTFSFNCI